MRNLYEVLGVHKGVTPEDLKKAYWTLAKEYHPDRNGGNEAAEEQFKELSEAYAILSDDEKRKQYDETGEIPKAQKSVEDIARENIMQSFLKMITTIPSEQLLSIDMIQVLKDAIQEAREDLSSQMQRVSKQLSAFKKAQSRIHVKKGCEYRNIFADLLDQQIATLEAKIPELEEQRKHHEAHMDKALEILNNFICDVDFNFGGIESLFAEMVLEGGIDNFVFGGSKEDIRKFHRRMADRKKKDDTRHKR